MRAIQPSADARPEHRLPPPGRPPTTALLPAGLMFAVLLAATGLMQWRDGAFAGMFAGDSIAHYVTGLMAHDWLRYAFGSNPVRYLINYHAHLPVTAFGLWPPLYYGVEAVWMLLFGTSVAALLSLSATVTASLGLAVGLVTARRAGWVGGLLVGLLLIGNPLVRRASNDLMLDVPDALGCFLAALAYAAYIARGRPSAVWGFGLIAASAMMIKYNATAMALLPPLCVLIGRRWDLLRRPSFYAPAFIVSLLVGPWYVLTHGLAEQGFQFKWGPTYLKLATLYNTASIIEGLTPLIAVLALLGLGRAIWQGSRRGIAEGTSIEIVCAALALSTFLFLLAVPIALQDRYLIPCLAPLMVLATHEAVRLFGRLRQPIARRGWIALLIIGAGIFAWPVQPVPHDRLRQAAQAAMAALPPSNPVVLVVADAATEPALIAAIAMTEPRRPMAWVIRGSRLFGGGGYNNADYQPRFNDPRALLEELDHYGVSLVIFQHTGAPHEWAHVSQFNAVLASAPQRFATAAEIPGPAPIRILRVLGNAARIPDPAALTALSGPQALLKLLH